MLQSHEIIQSLEAIREKVKEQLMNVREYRTFMAIEKSIAEFSDVNDIVTSLETTKEKIKDRLKEVREYQAMLAVEKSITDISEVLTVLAGTHSATRLATPEAIPVIRPAEPSQDSPLAAGVSEANVTKTEPESVVGGEADAVERARVA